MVAESASAMMKNKQQFEKFEFVLSDGVEKQSAEHANLKQKAGGDIEGKKTAVQ